MIRLLFPLRKPINWKHSSSVVSLPAYEYDPGLLLPLQISPVSSCIIFSVFSLFPLCFLCKRFFSDTSAQIRYDIYSSMLYVLNYCCHSSSECPPVDTLVQLADHIFIVSKGVFLSYETLKLFRNPRHCRGFSRDNKNPIPKRNGIF